MAEKLGEIGNVLSGISNAIRTMKLLGGKNKDLFRVTEEAKIQAAEVEKLNLPDEPLLAELKQQLSKVRDSGSRLEVWLKNFMTDTEQFDKFVRDKIKGSIPTHIVKDFCEILNHTHKMASDFSATFDTFIGHLAKSQQLATALTDKLKEKAEETEQAANSKQNWGAAKTVGLAVGGAGLLALGFFTGGATWVAAGALAGGAACGVGAAVTARNTAIDVKAMRGLASDIKVNSGKLEVIAKELKSSSDRAGTIQLDKEALDGLQTALEFYSKDMEKDDQIALQRQELIEYKERMAEMEAKMRMHGIH